MSKVFRYLFYGYLFSCNIALANAEVNNSISGVNKKFTIQAGIHYKKLTKQITDNKPIQQLANQYTAKVQVFMFFSYGCSACRHLSQPFDNWAKLQDKAKVAVDKIPVSFNYGWPILARAYYTAQLLQQSAILDKVIFAGIHEQAKPLWQEKKLAELFAEYNINKELFTQTFSSFVVLNKVKWGNDLALAFKLSSVPNVVIHGPYGSYVTNLVMTQKPEILLAVVEHLIKKES